MLLWSWVSLPGHIWCGQHWRNVQTVAPVSAPLSVMRKIFQQAWLNMFTNTALFTFYHFFLTPVVLVTLSWCQVFICGVWRFVQLVWLGTMTDLTEQSYTEDPSSSSQYQNSVLITLSSGSNNSGWRVSTLKSFCRSNLWAGAALALTSMQLLAPTVIPLHSLTDALVK